MQTNSKSGQGMKALYRTEKTKTNIGVCETWRMFESNVYYSFGKMTKK